MYADWRGLFYPEGLPQRLWLEYYATRFDTVELNATTYRLPSEAHVARWCSAVPEYFVYTVKLSRLITHRRSLPERVNVFIENYMQRVACFTPGKVGQLLVQFPPTLQRDDEHLRAFLAKLPRHHRYVVEFRHPSWHVAEVEAILAAENVAFCVHDYPTCKTTDVVTNPELAYVRLHGYRALYAGSYPRRVLGRWASRILGLAARAASVFVYFNNDTAAAAPKDAAVLRDLLSS
ncbi:MAG: DUF72 domain-containing protein [Candidatus Eremiobacteraeota bacterium]|nr:DUF72 domain-containing protein [Candidatus Eremiobacteraeota bacterium]